MTEADRDRLRELLIRYRHILALTETLAIALLDSVQPDAQPLTPEQARARRLTVSEAMTLVAGGMIEVERLWPELGLERRVAPPDAPLPPGVRVDRRRRSPKRLLKSPAESRMPNTEAPQAHAGGGDRHAR